jgi:dipicolinate synthase subunit A
MTVEPTDVDWPKLTIAMVGGDRREQEIARQAVATGARVKACAIPWPDEGIAGVERSESIAETLRDADVALFPIPGIAPDGALHAPFVTERVIPTRDALAGMRQPAHIILGWADANLKAHCDALGIELHEYEWDRALMLLRGPAIVEGMLRLMIERTEFTLHRARIVQVGQGTIGALATRTLLALGAHVHVAARNAEQRAAAYAAGADVGSLEGLAGVLPEADIVLTTVPARVLERPQLERIRPQTLIVDMSAPPGGVDWDVATELGLNAVWARGLGNRAPVTVGRSQWGGIRQRIEAIVAERGTPGT